MADSTLTLSAIRAALRRSDATWRAGDTPLATLTRAEKLQRLGYVPGPEEPPLAAREVAAAAGASDGISAPAAPARLDLRESGFITAVKDQGACGSCVAFGTIAAAEGTLRVARNDPDLDVDYAEAHLFYCAARDQGRRCGGAHGGWWVEPALDVLREQGAPDEACYPYTAGDQDCRARCTDWTTRATRITGWRSVTDPSMMCEWLATGGPLVTCLSVYEDFFAYRQGVYRHVAGELVGGHCVCVVGFDTTERYWIAKNSWGAGWGEDGFFRIGFGQVGIDATMWAIEGVEPPDGGPEWREDLRVTALWTKDTPGNAWIYLVPTGWCKLAGDSEVAVLQLLVLAASAKQQARPIRVLLEGTVVRQLYVL
jgi:C1A family cysteine protease